MRELTGLAANLADKCTATQTLVGLARAHALGTNKLSAPGPRRGLRVNALPGYGSRRVWIEPSVQTGARPVRGLLAVSPFLRPMALPDLGRAVLRVDRVDRAPRSIRCEPRIAACGKWADIGSRRTSDVGQVPDAPVRVDPHLTSFSRWRGIARRKIGLLLPQSAAHPPRRQDFEVLERGRVGNGRARVRVVGDPRMAGGSGLQRDIQCSTRMRYSTQLCCAISPK